MTISETSGVVDHVENGHAADLAARFRGAKVLWVTSSGGHLCEVHKIEEGLASTADSLWVTFDTPQSEAYLRDRRRLLVDYVAPRDVLGAVKAATRVAPYLRREKFDLCVSTGAALAAVILPMAACAGVPTYYIESVARAQAPSLTGRLMALAPRVRTLAQYETWSGKRWPYAGSLLDGWVASGAALRPRPLDILVTLGTIRPYRFDRAVNAVLDLLQPGDHVTWQLGSTTRPELPGDLHREISPTRLTELARAADVVVAQAPTTSTSTLPTLLAPRYCGLSTCRRGSPATGRICRRGPATSTTPEETTRSMSTASSCQARDRMPSAPKLSVLLTATMSAPVNSSAVSTSDTSPNTGTWCPCTVTALASRWDHPGTHTPTTR